MRIVKLNHWVVIVLAMISVNGYAQITNLSLSYGGGSPTCNPFEDDPNNFQHQWKVSHGTPATGDIYNDGFYDGALLGASFDWNSSEKTEGLFINYDFKSTNSYTITFELAHYSGNQLGISIYAVNGVVNDAGEDCNLDTTPSVSSKDEIYSDITVYDGPEGSVQGITRSEFIPDENYSQLWIHSTQEYTDQTGSFILTNVLIEDNGSIDNGGDDGVDDGGDNDQDRPTIPGNPRITQINENSFRLAWNQSINYDGGNVSGYTIYKATDYQSTYTVWDNLYLDIPFDCTNASHSYSVKAFNAENIYSARTDLVYIDVAESIILDTDESAKRDLTLIASNEIRFKPGFHFDASSYGDKLWGTIISCENSSSSREYISHNYEENYDSLQTEIKITSTIRTLDRKIPEDQLLNISPNPSKGVFGLTIAFESEKKAVVVSVYDMFGGIVEENIYENIRIIRADFDLSKEEKGLYIIQILAEDSKSSKKIILQ